MTTKPDITFIVVSIIYLSKRPLSYSNTRSVFSPRERAKQTLKTIQSIKKKIPDAKIILLESGLKKELPFKLNTLADEYFYIGDVPHIRAACDSPFKGLGEVMAMLYIKKYLKDSDHYFKLSGRYYLNESFNLKKWLGRDLVFKFRNWYVVSTVLYKFHSSQINALSRALMLTIPLLKIGRPLESVLSWFLPRWRLKKIKTLGVSGQIAVGGSINE